MSTLISGGFTRDEATGALLVTGTGQSAYGSGDAVQMFVATTPQFQRVSSGTAASPDTALGPLVKIERTIQLAAASVTGDGSEQAAGFASIVTATAADEVQPVALFGGAKTASTTGTNNDACGVYGVGRALSGATGSGLGGFFQGRRDSDSGRATAAEFNVYNGGATDGVYNSTGASLLKGIWLNANGTADTGVGVQFGNAFGRQFEVGIGFNAQVNNSKTGGVKTSSIRDDSTSAVSLDIRGTHATAAVTIASGSGPVLVGGQTQLSAGSLLELQTTTTVDPIFRISSSASSSLSQRIINSVGSLIVFLAGSSNAFGTGTVAGDGGLRAGASGKAVHLIDSGGQIRLSASSAGLAFQGTAPIAKPTVSGAKGSNAALGSLLTALANYGLVTDSTTA